MKNVDFMALIIRNMCWKCEYIDLLPRMVPQLC